jgi:Rrf2 family nitric oxide-sensitive transcriptional repressor
MRLKMETDYAMRTLMILAQNNNRVVRIADVATRLQISKNHLVKVVHRLARYKFLDTKRGHEGGIRLGRDAGDINIGKVIRLMEQDTSLVACFGGKTGNCNLEPDCRLKQVFARAQEQFFATLDGFTLDALIERNAGLAARLKMEEVA